MKNKTPNMIHVAIFTTAFGIITAYLSQSYAMDISEEKIYDDKVIYTTGKFESDQNEDGHFFTFPSKPQKPMQQCVLLYNKEPLGAVRETGKYETVLKKTNKKDGREWIEDTKIWPYSIHVQISLGFDGDTYVGSGVLISSHHVLTASHNVYKPEKKKWADRIEVYPGLTGKAAHFGCAKAARVYTFKEWINNGNDQYDCAILALDWPIGLHTGWGGLFCLDDAEEITSRKVSVTGYPVDKGCTQMWTMKHKIKTVEAEQFSYEIDTEGGQSGGGICTDILKNPYVMGVHTLGDLNINSGVRLSRYKFNEIVNWVINTRNIAMSIPVPIVAQGYEKIFQRFLNGVLIYRPEGDGNDIDRVTLHIRDLRNPLDGTFDLSNCGDLGKYMSISTGYRKGRKPENEKKLEIWLTPRFLIEKELSTTAKNFQNIFGKWEERAEVGIIWTWGGWDANEPSMDYLITQNMDELSKGNLYRRSGMDRYGKYAGGGGEHQTTGGRTRKISCLFIG